MYSREQIRIRAIRFLKSLGAKEYLLVTSFCGVPVASDMYSGVTSVESVSFFCSVHNHRLYRCSPCNLPPLLLYCSGIHATGEK